MSLEDLPTYVPALHTERLVVRPFEPGDLDAVHQIIDLDLRFGALTRDERARWLRWTIDSYEQLALLYQPPYGERAIALGSDDTVIGAVGYVPCLAPFGQLRAYHYPAATAVDRYFTPEVGLYWALASAYQGQGYATEAARAMVAHAFTRLHLKHIVATTEYDNYPSIGVMRRLGMRIERNPFDEPPWLQVVGVLENPATVG